MNIRQESMLLGSLVEFSDLMDECVDSTVLVSVFSG